MNRHSFLTRVGCFTAVLCAAVLASACGGGGGGGIVTIPPNVVVVVSTSPNSVPESGDDVSYTIVVLNNGAEDVTIDQFSDDVYDLDAECPDAVGTVLAPAENYTCVFVGFVSGDAVDSPVVNTVTVVISSASGGSDVLTASGSVTLLGVLEPQFAPDNSSPGPMTISMQDGDVTDAVFEIEILVTDIPDFFGAAFHISFDPGSVDFIDHDETGSVLSGMNPLFFVEEVAGSPGEIAIEASLQGTGAGLANANGLLLTLRFEATGGDAGNDFAFDPITARLVKECPTAGQPCNEIQDDLTWSGGTLTVN